MHDELAKRLREMSEWSNIEWEDYSDDAKETMREAADVIDMKCKVGHWIEHEDDWWGNYWECSNCHHEYSIIEGNMYYKHCPECGVKME